MMFGGASEKNDDDELLLLQTLETSSNERYGEGNSPLLLMLQI
jgi:hypothetical protein